MSRQDPAVRMQKLYTSLAPRDGAVVGLAIARLSVDLLVHDVALFQHALDVVGQWTVGAVHSDALDEVRPAIAKAASRADEDDHRAGWCAMEAVVALCDMAVEPMPILASKKARDVVSWVREAMLWPETDDPVAREEVEARIDACIDEAQRPFSALAVRSVTR